MGQRSNSCACCAQNCDVVAPSTLATQTAWDTLAGSWDAPTGTLTGTAITTREANGPQYWRAIMTANEPDQVLDILFGCDAAGEPDLFVRLTFGDSGVADSCGSIQLFESGVALEDAQPVYGLVDGLSQRVTICFDAAFGRFFVDIYGGFGGFPLPPIVVVANATALISDDAAGRLGLRLFDGQGGDASISISEWKRMFVSAQTCQSCHICGTSIESTHPDGLVAGSTCVHTVGSLFYFGPNPYGVSSVESHAIISAIDRQQKYGISVAGGALMDGGSSGVVLDVTLDNGHYAARLTISPRLDGSCPGFIVRTYHVDYYVELLYDGGVIATSPTQCTGFNSAGAGLFTFAVEVWFCENVISALGNVNVESGGPNAFASSAASQVGDGSAHGATVSRGGVSSFAVIRCMKCSYCEDCDDTATGGRGWRIEIEGTPNTYDGTYVVSSPNGVCGSEGSGGGLVWQVTNRRHNMHIGVPRLSPPGWHIEGVSSGPITDCDGLVDEVIPLTGLITGTATVTAL